MQAARILVLSWLAIVLGCSPSPDPNGGSGNPGGGPPPAGNVEPLIVEAVSPDNAALNIAVQQSVTITFNVAVSALSVDAQTISFTSPLGPVDGTLAVQDNVVTFTPAQDYPGASPITGTVTTSVEGAGGEEMADEFQWTFGTESFPEVIASGDGIEQPGVAVSAAGLVMTMWVQNDNGVYRLFARNWEPATGWVPAVEFVVSGEKISGLRLACTENNEAVGLWLEGHESPFTLRTARFTAGQGWAEPETLTDTCYITWTAFDLHREGWGGIVYYDITAEGAAIRVRYLNADGTWNDAVDTTFWLDNLTAGGDGALYSSHSFTNSRTNAANNYVTRYFPGEGLDEGTVDGGSGHVVFGSATDPIGALTYYISNGDVSVWRFDGLAWNQIGSLDLFGDGYTVSADLASGPAGEACLAWTYQATGDLYRDLMGAYMDSDGLWTEPESLESFDGLVFDPVAACTDEGEGWVVFGQFDDDNASIWFARCVPGTGWEPTVEIDDDEFMSSQPRLAAQGPGGCALWLRENGTTQLMARILN